MKRYLAIFLIAASALLTPFFAFAAIAIDAVSTGGQTTTETTLSWAHTITGTDTILTVGLTEEGADDITGITYNSVALTLGKKGTGGTGYGRPELWYLINPTTGANTVTITRTGTTGRLTGVAASYTGAKQSGQPDATGSNNVTTATSMATSVTTVADNSWTIMMTDTSAAGEAAGAGTTLRQAGSDASDLWDSNAAITPAGSTSLNITMTSGNAGSAMISIAPAVADAGGVAQASQPLIAFGFE